MKYKSISLAGLLALSLITATTAGAGAAPEGGEPKDFSLPAAYEFELSNGMKATLVPFGAVPKVSVGIVTRVGNINEAPDQNWLNDLIGEMIQEGTTTRSAEEISNELAGMGGEFAIRTGLDRTTISVDVLAEHGNDLVHLLADMVRNPAFPESELGRLKDDMIRNLSLLKSRPGAIADEKFRNTLYPDHPNGRLFPDEQMIGNFSIDMLKDFHSRNYGGARTHLYAVGSFNRTDMERAIRDAFEDWQEGIPPAEIPATAKSDRMIHLVDRPGAPQSTLRIGISVIDPSHPDYIPLLVTNALLGGAFSSRITANIREDKGYTYSPYSSVNASDSDTYWMQEADVTTDATGPSLKEIFFEIDKLQNEAPREPELKAIQNWLAGSFVRSNSSRGGIMGQLVFADLHGLGRDYLVEYVKAVHAVTPEQVRSMADQYLRNEEMLIVIVGDREKIEGQIGSFGEILN